MAAQMMPVVEKGHDAGAARPGSYATAPTRPERRAPGERGTGTGRLLLREPDHFERYDACKQDYWVRGGPAGCLGPGACMHDREAG